MIRVRLSFIFINFDCFLLYSATWTLYFRTYSVFQGLGGVLSQIDGSKSGMDM